MGVGEGVAVGVGVGVAVGVGVGVGKPRINRILCSVTVSPKARAASSWPSSLSLSSGESCWPKVGVGIGDGVGLGV